MATQLKQRPRRRLAPWDEIAEDWSWSDEHHRDQSQHDRNRPGPTSPRKRS